MKDKDGYKIADVSKEDFEAIKKAEEKVREETNKNLVLIAWENTNIS